MRTNALHDSEIAAPGTAQTPARREASATVLALPVETRMHADVYKLALLCWVGLLLVFWVTFSISSNALFMVVIATFYATVFFGVPFIFSRLAKPLRSRLGLGAFMRGKFDTIYGPVTGFDALLQVILVPLALAIGGVAIGIIIWSARAMH